VQQLPPNTPDIIEAAAKSPLGIAALIILVCTAVCVALFRKDPNPKVRMGVFALFFVGLIVFGLAVLNTNQPKPLPLPLQSDTSSVTPTISPIHTPTPKPPLPDPNTPTPTPSPANRTTTVYIYIASEEQQNSARRVQAALQQKGYNTPGIIVVRDHRNRPERNTEVRFFNERDRDTAESIASDLRNEGAQNVPAICVGPCNTRADYIGRVEIRFDSKW